MKTLPLILILLLSLAMAEARCKIASELAMRYGISSTDVVLKLQPVARPDAAGWATAQAIQLPGKGDIRDGFNHLLLIHRNQKQAMVLKTGGIVGVEEWLGPISMPRKLSAAELDACGRRENPLLPPV